MNVFRHGWAVCWLGLLLGVGAQEGQLTIASDWEGDWNLYTLSLSTGRLELLVAGPGSDFHPAWSPDGKRLAFFSSWEGRSNLFLYEEGGEEGGTLRRLTFGDWTDKAPAWSPDGRALVFSSDREGSFDLYRFDLVRGTEERLTDWEGDELLPAWSPDGTVLAFAAVVGGNEDIYLLNWRTGQVRRMTEGPRQDCYPAWSPDGRTLLFASAEDGDLDLYRLNVASGVREKLFDTPGDEAFPSFSPDGNWIAFQYESEWGTWAVAVSRPDGTERRDWIADRRGWFTKPVWRPKVTTGVSPGAGSLAAPWAALKLGP
ncbi:MAG: hypothetical protein KatS3mg115_1078 [Candidatus Poribacteria bacterium]|nr:MAG: hypothetical protein KatS3mg115_1078 [Candidatus Poribacteria bacterium]